MLIPPDDPPALRRRRIWRGIAGELLAFVVLTLLAPLLSESDSDRRRSFADVLIRPDHEGIGILEFHMLDRMRAAGRRAAAEALAAAPPSVFG
jgi:predicted acylesterase/phospholipase RssA